MCLYLFWTIAVLAPTCASNWIYFQDTINTWQCEALYDKLKVICVSYVYGNDLTTVCAKSKGIPKCQMCGQQTSELQMLKKDIFDKNQQTITNVDPQCKN